MGRWSKREVMRTVGNKSKTSTGTWVWEAASFWRLSPCFRLAPCLLYRWWYSIYCCCRSLFSSPSSSSSSVRPFRGPPLQRRRRRRGPAYQEGQRSSSGTAHSSHFFSSFLHRFIAASLHINSSAVAHNSTPRQVIKFNQRHRRLVSTVHSTQR